MNIRLHNNHAGFVNTFSSGFSYYFNELWVIRGQGIRQALDGHLQEQCRRFYCKMHRKVYFGNHSAQHKRN